MLIQPYYPLVLFQGPFGGILIIQNLYYSRIFISHKIGLPFRIPYSTKNTFFLSIQAKIFLQQCIMVGVLHYTLEHRKFDFLPYGGNSFFDHCIKDYDLYCPPHRFYSKSGPSGRLWISSNRKWEGEFEQNTSKHEQNHSIVTYHL